LEIPDYFSVITRPMDLGTVSKKLTNAEYPSAEAFAEDVRLVWSNAITYNGPESEVHQMAQELSDLFEASFPRIFTETNSIKSIVKSAANQVANKKAMSSVEESSDHEEITPEKKEEMLFALQSLDGELLKSLIHLIAIEMPHLFKDDNQLDFEINLDTLEPMLLHRLKSFYHCLVDRSCTFTKTEFSQQSWFSCNTCWPAVSNRGCCITCVVKCHHGHEVKYSNNSPFYCDCGAGDAPAPCASLPTEPLSINLRELISQAAGEIPHIQVDGEDLADVISNSHKIEDTINLMN